MWEPLAGNLRPHRVNTREATGEGGKEGGRGGKVLVVQQESGCVFVLPPVGTKQTTHATH